MQFDEQFVLTNIVVKTDLKIHFVLISAPNVAQCMVTIFLFNKYQNWAFKSIQYWFFNLKSSSNFRLMISDYLHHRFCNELKYWHLKWWQFFLLLIWSCWSSICNWLFPGHSALWLFPQLPFLFLGYIGGSFFMFIFQGQSWSYRLGYSSTVFLFSYLALVSWRWHREGRKSISKDRDKD